MTEGFFSSLLAAFLVPHSPHTVSIDPVPAWTDSLSIARVNLTAAGWTENDLVAADAAWTNAAEAVNAFNAAQETLDEATHGLSAAVSAAQAAPMDAELAASLAAASTAHAEALATRDGLRSSLLTTVLQGVDAGHGELLLLASTPERASLPGHFRVATLTSDELLQLEVGLAAQARAERQDTPLDSGTAQFIAEILTQPAVAQATVHLQQAELE